MRSSNPDLDDDVPSTSRVGDGGWGMDDLDLLAELGFGPASQLMTEPKLFIDARFLAALQVEFEHELGVDEARFALFQIGLLHGLRDAARFGDQEPGFSGMPDLVGATPLAMRFGAIQSGPFGLELEGCWPDAHEAEAHLSKLGKSPHHACVLSAGYTSGWLTASFDVEMLAVETGCAASGGSGCSFRGREIAAWHRDESTPEAVRALLARVPIDRLRDLVRGDADTVAAVSSHEPASVLDADDPAVHVWGPVMVMPFREVETALEAAATLGRDPSMRAVRVVVLDLAGAVLDDGFGAAGLEQLIEEIEAWGADVILTGISPFSAEVVADLEATHLLVRKDVPEAIAYAFQIAEAHRHLL